MINTAKDLNEALGKALKALGEGRVFSEIDNDSKGRRVQMSSVGDLSKSGEGEYSRTPDGKPYIDVSAGRQDAQEYSAGENDEVINVIAAALAHELQHDEDLGPLTAEQWKKQSVLYNKLTANGFQNEPSEMRARARGILEKYSRLYGDENFDSIDSKLFEIIDEGALNSIFQKQLLFDLDEVKQENPKMYKKLLSTIYKFAVAKNEWQKDPKHLGTVSDLRAKNILRAIKRKWF